VSTVCHAVAAHASFTSPLLTVDDHPSCDGRGGSMVVVDDLEFIERLSHRSWLVRP